MKEDTITEKIRKHLPAGIKTVPKENLPNFSRAERRHEAAIARKSGKPRSRIARKRKRRK